MTIQQILDRLTALAQALPEGSETQQRVERLRLDIEIDCRREGVPFV